MNSKLTVTAVLLSLSCISRDVSVGMIVENLTNRPVLFSVNNRFRATVGSMKTAEIPVSHSMILCISSGQNVDFYEIPQQAQEVRSFVFSRSIICYGRYINNEFQVKIDGNYKKLKTMNHPPDPDLNQSDLHK